MYFVEGDGRRAPDQRFGVSPGQIRHVEIVEGQEAALPGGQHLDQRTLAGLPCPGDDHSRHHAQPLREGPLEMAG